MYLGVRQIRTAGKGSGSIELTLPADLRDLVGLPCRILLRDGSRPDIVLQPDLARAQATFASLWDRMAEALLHESADAGFPLTVFAFGLQPREGTGETPFLSWRDGLVLSGTAPHEPAATARSFAGFGQAMAADLHIAPALARGFGVACGYLVGGVPPSGDWQEACDLTAAGLRGRFRPGAPLAAALGCAEGVTGALFWEHAAPLLTAVTELFVDWTADPSIHATLRAAWRRGRSIEMSGG